MYELDLLGNDKKVILVEGRFISYKGFEENIS